jgi:hypothetical protein
MGIAKSEAKRNCSCFLRHFGDMAGFRTEGHSFVERYHYYYYQYLVCVLIVRLYERIQYQVAPCTEHIPKKWRGARPHG